MQNNTEEKKSISERLDFAYNARLTDIKLSTSQALTAYEESCTIKDTYLELRAINMICTAALYNQDFKEHDKWIDLLLRRSIELNNLAYKGKSYIFKYRWSFKAGKLTEAAQFLLNALEFLDSEKHPQIVATCYNGLGRIYYRNKNYDKAYEYLMLAKPFAANLPLGFFLNLQQNIAAIHILRKDYAKAWNIFHDLLPKIPDSELVIKTIVLQNLGHICQITNELTEALYYFQQTLQIKLNAGISEEIIRTLCNIVYIYLDSNNPSKAYDTLLLAKQKLPNCDLTEEIYLYKAYMSSL